MFVICDSYQEGLIPYKNRYYGFANDFTKFENFLSCGYLHNDSLVSFKHHSKFSWSINSTTKTKNDLHTHSIFKAESILKEKENIKLLVSGGIDSEHLAASFLDFKKDVELVFFDYYYNSIDKQDLLSNKTFKQFSINIERIDAYKFFKNNEHLLYGLRYRTSFPEVMLFLYALDCIKKDNSYFIIAGDIPEPTFTNNKINYSFPSDNICAIDRWKLSNNVDLCSSFLLHDEQSLYITLKELCKPKYYNFEYKHKKEFYNSLGYNLELRKMKYTGLESLRKELKIWNFSDIIEEFKLGNTSEKLLNFLKDNSDLLEEYTI